MGFCLHCLQRTRVIEQTLIVGCRAVITTPGPPYLHEVLARRQLRVKHTLVVIPADLLLLTRTLRPCLLLARDDRPLAAERLGACSSL